MNPTLSQWLADNGRTQKWLAEAVGVREATVSGWMSGTMPRAQIMGRIAEVTDGGVPVQSWFAAQEDAA